MGFVKAGRSKTAGTSRGAVILLVFALVGAAAKAGTTWLSGTNIPQALQQQYGVTALPCNEFRPSSSNTDSRLVEVKKQQQAWQAYSAHYRRTLQQQQQQQQQQEGAELSMPPVNYAYNGHNATELSQIVPGFDTHGLRMSRFVVSAWSISNFSNPEVLNDDMVQTVHEMIAEYLNVSDAQVSEA
jgi:hypothetical protein